MNASADPKPLQFQQIDWWPLNVAVQDRIRMALAGDPKLGPAISHAEGEAFVRRLASDVMRSVRAELEQPEE